MTLAIRNGVGLDGAPLELAVENGKIAAEHVQAVEIDATGCTILPGLHDHHIHLLATAARLDSLDLSGCESVEELVACLAAHQARTDATEPMRAVGYDERAAGLLDRDLLDRLAPHRPLRVQDRTGALWTLNTSALDLLAGAKLPSGAERDASGKSNGRFWREDAWLGVHFPKIEPKLGHLGAELAAYGVTGVTDAGWRNGPAEAKTLGNAHRAGLVPQRLTLMGDESLPEGLGYTRGALKLMIDERDPPDIEALALRIGDAREQARPVAAHCVTATELALFLAALDVAGGACAGDRIEHGGVISDAALAEVAATGLTVVTNPAFIHDRGERYRRTIPSEDWPALYRAAGLIEAGVPLAAGSDAPYAGADPWLAMRSSRDRKTAMGEPLVRAECLSPAAALRLYLGTANDPGGPPRRLDPGHHADLVVCEGQPRDVLADLTAERVRLTVIAGKIAFSRA